MFLANAAISQDTPLNRRNDRRSKIFIAQSFRDYYYLSENVTGMQLMQHNKVQR
jgi:hypothetical protein